MRVTIKDIAMSNSSLAFAGLPEVATNIFVVIRDGVMVRIEKHSIIEIASIFDEANNRKGASVNGMFCDKIWIFLTDPSVIGLTSNNRLDQIKFTQLKPEGLRLEIVVSSPPRII